MSPAPLSSVAPRQPVSLSLNMNRSAPKRRKTDSASLPLDSDGLPLTRASTPDPPSRSPRESEARSPRIRTAVPSLSRSPTPTAFSLPSMLPAPLPNSTLGPSTDNASAVPPSAQEENQNAVVPCQHVATNVAIPRAESEVRTLPTKPFSLKEMRAPPVSNLSRVFLMSY